MPALFIGLMSGTSMDGIDAVLAEFGDRSVTLLDTRRRAYPKDLSDRLRRAALEADACTADDLGELDTWVGECFRDAALALIESADGDIRAIGSHGQTLRHRPDAGHRFTLQIGNPAIIAAATGVDTVADFRRVDLALGGQGAPLVPPFHDWLFRNDAEHRAVVNIGGIANVTILPAGRGTVSGFDTGPGNALLDAWIRKQRQQSFDERGEWAGSGRIDAGLLERLLADPWFRAPPPKSTGSDYFNLAWLERQGVDALDAADVQATLSELTAASIADALRLAAPATARLLVCGGGVHNADLLTRLCRRLDGIVVEPTSVAGVGPDWVEAAAFAWLARQRIDRLPGNLPSVTGASRQAVLGAVYAGRGRDIP